MNPKDRQAITTLEASAVRCLADVAGIRAEVDVASHALFAQLERVSDHRLCVAAARMIDAYRDLDEARQCELEWARDAIRALVPQSMGAAG